MAKKVVTLHSQNGNAACDCDGERVLRPGPGLEEGERNWPWRQEDIDRMLQDKSSKLLDKRQGNTHCTGLYGATPEASP